LGQRLGFAGAQPTGVGQGLVWRGSLDAPTSGTLLAGRLSHLLGRTALHVSGRGHPIRTVAWCTGAAQGFIDEAATLGVDAYVSGEISEQTTHQARELGIDYFAVGHHASERYGVEALGEHLARRFGIAHRFIDIDNPA
jgi:putative NIF3 family GTP cyclohydrolase 1 type 2